MAASCLVEEKSADQTVKEEVIEEVVTEKHLTENSDSYEYIECTPLLLGIGNGSVDKDGTAKKLQCPSCEYKTRRRDLLLSHTMLHEKEASLSCKGQQNPTCAFTMFPRGEQFFYKCIRCFYITVAWPEIKRHVRRKHTGDTAYSCDWCTEYTSPNLAHLKYHVERKHWRNLPYRCESCKYTAWHLREFQLHKLKHTIPATLRCTLCAKKSTDRKLFINNLKDRSKTLCLDCKTLVDTSRRITRSANNPKKKKN